MLKITVTNNEEVVSQLNEDELVDSYIILGFNDEGVRTMLHGGINSLTAAIAICHVFKNQLRLGIPALETALAIIKSENGDTLVEDHPLAGLLRNILN